MASEAARIATREEELSVFHGMTFLTVNSKLRPKLPDGFVYSGGGIWLRAWKGGRSFLVNMDDPVKLVPVKWDSETVTEIDLDNSILL